jgi:hypothetical protein
VSLFIATSQSRAGETRHGVDMEMPAIMLPCADCGPIYPNISHLMPLHSPSSDYIAFQSNPFV